jgi:hypothetical protein
MNTHKMTVSLIALALAASTITLASFSGCGSSNNSPDAGNDSSFPDTGHGSGGTKGTGAGGTSGSGGSKGTGSGGTKGSPTDGGIDTGTCKSDSGFCNTCYTDAQAAADPYNACSAYTASCVQFTGTVPTVPPL